MLGIGRREFISLLGGAAAMMSADGYLMPAKKDQPPPDLRYFNQARK